MSTLETKQEDVLLLFMVKYNKEVFRGTPILIPALHQVWGLYIELLERNGVRIGGFFKDPVVPRYPALDKTIARLAAFGWIERTSLLENQERFLLKLSDRDELYFLRDVNQELRVAVSKIFPEIRNWYFAVEKIKVKKDIPAAP